MSNETSEAPTGARAKSSAVRQTLAVVLALAIGGMLGYGAFLYWEYESTHPSAEDAYLMANAFWISPRVHGQVTEVLVEDNQRVEAGAELFRLDQRPFAAALEKATSAEALVKQGIEIQKSAVESAEAKVREQLANLDEAKAERDRVSTLVKRGDMPKLRGIEVEDVFKAARAKLEDLQAELDLARKTLGPPQIQQARIDEAAADVALARLDLDWTRVSAPSAGWATRVALRAGDVVQPGNKLFVLVEDGDWWVQANYKETKLAAIAPGMPAEVSIDLYDGRRFEGRVESIGYASAASFALLPAQNTTGSWVKVTQRIPVRIGLDPMDPMMPYRLGASASVTVITTAATGDTSSADPEGRAGAAGTSPSAVSAPPTGGQ
jgi:membrane fusion protein (multidrug efflux system)